MLYPHFKFFILTGAPSISGKGGGGGGGGGQDRVRGHHLTAEYDYYMTIGTLTKGISLPLVDDCSSVTFGCLECVSGGKLKLNLPDIFLRLCVGK